MKSIRKYQVPVAALGDAPEDDLVPGLDKKRKKPGGGG